MFKSRDKLTHVFLHRQPPYIIPPIWVIPTQILGVELVPTTYNLDVNQHVLTNFYFFIFNRSLGFGNDGLAFGGEG